MIRRISESRLRQLIRRVLTEKRFVDFNAPKGEYVDLTKSDFDHDRSDPQGLDKEIFDLVQTAYAKAGGNLKVSAPTDLPGEYTYNVAADLDADPEPDVYRGGKIRGGRLKLGISGHDGSGTAKDASMQRTAAQLMGGAFAEMSKAAAHMMITRHGVPAITNHEEVEAYLGKPVVWKGPHPDPKLAARYGPNYEGWYERDIGGKSEVKILLTGG
jgi:hypothetical protein